MNRFRHTLRYNRFTVALVATITLGCKNTLAVAQWLAAITLLGAVKCFGSLGFGTPVFAMGVTASPTIDEQLTKALEGLTARLARLEEIEKTVQKNKADYDQVTGIVTEVKLQLDDFRRKQVGMKVQRFGGIVDIHRQHQVGDDCARYLGALGALAILRTPSLDQLSSGSKQYAEAVIKEMLGIEAKAALTTADIPMPTDYSGQVVELVYQYGFGRRLATVFPMGTLTVKLPKLTTDPTFGLIAQSGTVTEKSPQVGFVTFTAEKFGGLVRLPTEIDEDSIVAMGQFLARYSARNLARVEDVQVFTSTGADSGINGAVKGLTGAVVDDSCIYVQGGATNSGKTANNQATLADFRNLRSGSGISGVVLNNAKYYMHPTYESLLVTFNTSATVTPYQRAANGQPATLDGFPIEWVTVMPPLSASVSATTVNVLFGDATYQYLGTRGGIRFDTSREAAFATDEVLVRALERLTVGLMATKAVAGLSTSTT